MLATLLAALALCSSAWADGDPASDVLLGESVFYPYSPAVSGPVEKALNAEMAAAARAHFPLKVALIASPVDLGVIPDLFGKPQKYADFLDQEISFQATKLPLLVVMPAGYGVQGLPAAVVAAAAKLPKPVSGRTDDLARAAMAAVPRLARADGRSVGAAASPSSGAGGTGSTTLVIILAAVAVLVAALLLLLRRRRRTAAS